MEGESLAITVFLKLVVGQRGVAEDECRWPSATTSKRKQVLVVWRAWSQNVACNWVCRDSPSTGFWKQTGAGRPPQQQFHVHHVKPRATRHRRCFHAVSAPKNRGGEDFGPLLNWFLRTLNLEIRPRSLVASHTGNSHSVNGPADVCPAVSRTMMPSPTSPSSGHVKHRDRESFRFFWLRTIKVIVVVRCSSSSIKAGSHASAKGRCTAGRCRC